MTFTLTFGYPTICFLVTLTMWAGLLLWPSSAPSGNDFGAGAAISGFLRMTGGVIGTLVIWLFYFALLVHV